VGPERLASFKAEMMDDRTIMLPFINWWPFYPQTSLEKLPRTALPLTEIPML
jgi:hypothetical protein